MQDSDKRENIAEENEIPVSGPKPGRHSKASAPAEAIVIEEEEILGDEGDIPLRKKKKTTASSKKKPKKKRKKAKKAGGKIPPLFSEKKFRRKKNIFEIMSGTGEDSLFKPIHVFGHEIRFWPLFILAAIIVLVGVVVMSNGNVKLINKDVTVVGLPGDFENYNILVLSDLNGKRFGDEQSALIRQLDGIDYDMILCMGDMVGKDGDPEPFYELLEGVDAEKVYFVCGDADPGPYVESPRQIQGTLEQIVLEDWILGAMERGANYVDAPISLMVGESKLWLTPTSFLNLEAAAYQEEWKDQMRQEEDGVISGIAADYNSLPFTSHRYALAQQFYQATREISTNDLIIGLSHVVPDDDFIRAASTHDGSSGNYLPEPELIVSGHYCGGVWQVPVYGAIYVPNRMLPRNGWFPAREDVSGLSRIGESQVYISGGMSTTSAVPVLPFRLFNDPEINLLTLSSKLADSILTIQ